MFGAPDVWRALLGKIAGISAAYLDVQVVPLGGQLAA